MALMATEPQLDIDISPGPDGSGSPPPDGCGQQAMGRPARQSGRPLLAFAALMLLLLGALALLIEILQPFADQVGGCGGG
jgi:hypothetical protein